MAAAAALVQRGCSPTILDTGLSPEPDALALKTQLAETDPDAWKSEDLIPAKRLGPAAANGIPRKLYFGSDFTFRRAGLAPLLDVSRASLYRSFAAGGFSNVWGAVTEPLPQSEMKNWPVPFEELDPHYAAVRRLMCAIPESIEIAPAAAPDRFPGELRPSSQARELYADLWANRRDLESADIRFAYSRLAVRAVENNGEKGCCYCGLCLHGCPYDCIYTAAATLERLRREGRVGYIPGVIVDTLAPENGCIRINARSLVDGTLQSFRGERVFMAAGLLETARIILTSLGLRNVPFRAQHSDIFTLPFLRYSAAPGIAHERLHTLCQLVIQIEDEAVCPHPVHLQFYGYNDLYAALAAHHMGVWARPLAPFVNMLATRLFIIFGYLHSSVSSTIALTLTGGQNPGLRLEGQPTARAVNISRAVARKLLRYRRRFRAVPVGFQLRLDLPGGGYHSGGIFPMKLSPGAFETNRLGSLASLSDVHIVDSTVLPEIPPFPTAFTTMANAHRIASEIEVSCGS
jgi:ferredoxin